MNIKEYAEKWKRPEDNNLAAASYANSIDELQDARCGDNGAPDRVDMEHWGITDAQEWSDAVEAAYNDKVRDAIIELNDTSRGLAIAVEEWANCQTAEIDEAGDVWVDGPGTGGWIPTDAIVEFLRWNKEQSA